VHVFAFRDLRPGSRLLVLDLKRPLSLAKSGASVDSDGLTDVDQLARLAFPGASWEKSSRSAQNGHCVEVARLSADSIGVRDSKDTAPGRPVLVFARQEWAGFLQGIKAGDFDFADR
jgi:ABC-type amino acid transport substrate-binding protein